MSSVGHHHELAPGVDAWRFEYCEPRRRQAGFADGLEIFLQLEGDFGLGTPLRPTTRQRFRPGELMVLDSGEAYRHAAEGLGRQVGFTIRPDQLAPLFGTTDDVHLPAGAGRDDRRLVELARQVAARGELDGALSRQAYAELTAFIRRHATLRPRDPVALAKSHIERDPQHELYVHHLAELVGLHPATLRRHFRARYGASPIGFRKRIRLNRAAWLLWSQPERAVADLAIDAGFVDESFFHRTFRAVVGITPAQYRARHGPGAD